MGDQGAGPMEFLKPNTISEFFQAKSSKKNDPDAMGGSSTFPATVSKAAARIGLKYGIDLATVTGTKPALIKKGPSGIPAAKVGLEVKPVLASVVEEGPNVAHVTRQGCHMATQLLRPHTAGVKFLLSAICPDLSIWLVNLTWQLGTAAFRLSRPPWPFAGLSEG